MWKHGSHSLISNMVAKKKGCNPKHFLQLSWVKSNQIQEFAWNRTEPEFFILFHSYLQLVLTGVMYVPAEGSALVSLNFFRHLLLAVKASWTGSIINPKSSYADAVQKSEKKKNPIKTNYIKSGSVSSWLGGLQVIRPCGSDWTDACWKSLKGQCFNQLIMTACWCLH